MLDTNEMMLGLNVQFAAKRWPEPEQWVPIARQLDVEHAQFSFDLLDPFMADGLSEYAHIGKVAREHGLNITSAYTGSIAYYQNMLMDPRPRVRGRAEQWYATAVEAAAELGAESVGGHIGTMSLTDFADDERRSQGIRSLREIVVRLSQVAERAGLQSLIWEIHQFETEYPARMADVEHFFAELNEDAAVPVLLCLDLGHACLPGASATERDPYEWLARFGHEARCVSLQQTDGVVDRHWPFTDEFNASGIIEPARVVEILREVCTEPVEMMLEVSFRHDVPPDRVLDDLRQSIDHWRPHLD